MEGMVFLSSPSPLPQLKTAIAIAIIVNIYRAVGNTDINSVKNEILRYGHYTSNFDSGSAVHNVPYLGNRRCQDVAQACRCFKGICGNGALLAMAYTVAFTYFFSGNPEFIADGIRQQVQLFDVTWLAFTERMVVNI